MAVRKKTSAIKNPPKHLLGIQNLSVQEAKQILKEAKEFISLNRSASKKLDTCWFQLPNAVSNDPIRSPIADISIFEFPNDDYVSTTAIDTLTYLNVSNQYIFDLTGIEDFNTLTILLLLYKISYSLSCIFNCFFTT